MIELTEKEKWAYGVITKELNNNDYITVRGVDILYSKREKDSVGSLDRSLFHKVLRKANIIVIRLDGMFRDKKQNCPMDVYLLPNKLSKVMELAKTEHNTSINKRIRELQAKIKTKKQFISRLEKQKRQLKDIIDELKAIQNDKTKNKTKR